ncbi:MAG: hypothetical protein CR962_00255 [Gammaproteobacteria bacterium]|nr:MAG: hypothetical protein CR962_00255 [Gammaproteobacteria bacterium]
MYNYNLSKKQNGLNLIELMVALVLGLIVIIGVTQSLISISKSSRVQARNAELSETADTALSYISFRLHNALSSPCERYSKVGGAGELNIRPLAGGFTDTAGSTETISATQATDIGNLINGFGVNVISTPVNRDFGSGAAPVNTNDITLISIGDRLFPTTNVNFTTTTIGFNGIFTNTRVKNETLYAITDCKTMDVFRASRNVSGGNTTLTLAAPVIEKAYRTGDLSIVSPLDVTTISVDVNRRLSDDTVFIPTGGSLIDNIELIRVLFGVDKTGNGIADQYIIPSQLTSLPSGTTVLSADIYMMVRAPGGSDRAYDDNYNLQMPDTSTAITGATPTMETFTITDQIPRRVFMRSVVFRNNAITL